MVKLRRESRRGKRQLRLFGKMSNDASLISNAPFRYDELRIQSNKRPFQLGFQIDHDTIPISFELHRHSCQ